MTAIADPSIAPVAVDLLACLTAAVAQTASPPKGISLRPTPVALYLSTVRDECCEGVAWVGLDSAFPSATFPIPDAVPSRCGALQHAALFELGVARCAPTPAANQIPSPDAWNTVTGQVLDDAAAMRRAICCYEDLHPDTLLLPGLWQPIPAEGGCVGGIQFVTIAVGACDC